MVAACLVKDPKKRPTSEKLLKHPFFKHARSTDYLTRTVLDGLPPLGDRFRMLKVLCSSHTMAFKFLNICEWNINLFLVIYHFMQQLLISSYCFRQKKQIFLYRIDRFTRTRNIYRRLKKIIYLVLPINFVGFQSIICLSCLLLNLMFKNT